MPMLHSFKQLEKALEFVRSHDLSGGITGDLLSRVETIRQAVSSEGDAALSRLTRQFDGVISDDFDLVVSKNEISDAYSRISDTLLAALKTAKESIEAYHVHQQPSDWQSTPSEGISYGAKWSAIEAAGLYVPGGRAVYPSTVLMNAVPAKLAGVNQLVMTSPPQPDGRLPDSIVVAADLCGVDVMIKSGGAQAVFALASGTDSVPKVDKIVGPGNIYVTAAKQLVYGQVDIDKPAGPSEVLVYIDQLSYAAYAASELLAQLEHDPDAIAVCVSESAEILAAVQSEFARLFTLCKRQEIIRESVKQSVLLQTTDLSESIRAMDAFATEHLVLLSDDFEDILPQVRHGGSIFCGPYTPVALGDYCAGPNHVLPTGGAARFASPLGVLDFMKYSAVTHFSRTALADISGTIDVLTTEEGFDAHNLSVTVRLEDE